MGRIHVLSEHVANKIAAGEVVERPASVVKELIENSLDAGATRVRVDVEAGGRKLIHVTDNGCGMVRDDALLAFERHATSKLKNDQDLLSIATLGFRGEALPSIASVSRLRLETRDGAEASGTVVEIAGGRILTVEEAGLPAGTSISIRDLFFNTPARRKFLKAESTELSHIASLVTHYALAHPEMHWELHSTTNAILVAPPVSTHSERIYQVFGKDTLDELIPLAAQIPLERVGLPEPPPWLREPDYEPATPGDVRIHGFTSKPEIQKLNRNSIFIFVNGRLIRDKVVMHGILEAYRNIIPPTVYPVVLLFLEMPCGEVDVNVHPSKTEVRFRQQSFIHDFVRDGVRSSLMAARPAPAFTGEIHAGPSARVALTPALPGNTGEAALPTDGSQSGDDGAAFSLIYQSVPARNEALPFTGSIAVQGNGAIGAAKVAPQGFGAPSATGEPQEAVPEPASSCALPLDGIDEAMDLSMLGTLKPLGQIRDSFILATNPQGLWIIDQHVAHERVLFEKILAERASRQVEAQRLLMPIIVELKPAQQAIFSDIAEELRRNGFEAEPFGIRTIAIQSAPAGITADYVSDMLQELLEQLEHEEQVLNLEKIRTRIAASIACHAAIKVNMPLDTAKMEWLLAELAKTQYPMSCPHGRPVVLRYSVKDIQKAFKRI
ncbi:MAG TPA: DNA mismatch repair endonuclease MutL [Candidatus Saccharimonadales bacterium]|nr:DNA mismatch repair endonuclease MutL [Candidatus Saccharimonadales bacterium]